MKRKHLLESKSNRRTILSLFLLTVLLTIYSGGSANGMQGHEGGNHSDKSATHEIAGQRMADNKADHSDMNHGSSTTGGTFKHEMMADGVHAEFQVMSLKSMNMSDDQGNTHHIMVKMFAGGNNQQAKEAIGKIKVIAPDGKEQVNSLKNYNGILAANFSFPQPGRYGVICLAMVDGQKKLFKFWYPHQ